MGQSEDSKGPEISFSKYHNHLWFRDICFISEERNIISSSKNVMLDDSSSRTTAKIIYSCIDLI